MEYSLQLNLMIDVAVFKVSVLLSIVVKSSMYCCNSVMFRSILLGVTARLQTTTKSRHVNTQNDSIKKLKMSRTNITEFRTLLCM